MHMYAPLTQLSLGIHAVTPPAFFVFLCMLFVSVLLYTKRKREAAIFSVAFIATVLIVTILKYTFAVQRPEAALITLTDYAFPSSHAAFSAFLATMLGWLDVHTRQYSRIHAYFFFGFFYVLALMVALSRLVIGVHTPFQITVGFLLGVLIPLVVIYGARRVYPTI